MPNNREKKLKYYFDAGVFLALINREAGRAGIIEAMIAESERGEFEIFTSLISITEVAFAETEKKGRALDLAVENDIDALWHPSSPIRLVDPHLPIVRESRNLLRLFMQNRRSLQAMDAIHLASAKNEGVDCIFTYDEKWLSAAALIGIKFRNPQTDSLAFE